MSRRRWHSQDEAANFDEMTQIPDEERAGGSRRRHAGGQTIAGVHVADAHQDEAQGEGSDSHTTSSDDPASATDPSAQTADRQPQRKKWSLNAALNWRGFELRNVELRRDFLAELAGLPVDVPIAVVHRAVLQVPWYFLMLGCVKGVGKQYCKS